MHNLPVAWRLATSALLLLLHDGHPVTRADKDTGNSKEVKSTLVMDYSLNITPNTKLEYGDKVILRCNLMTAYALGNSVYHVWLFQKSLPVRMAAFHPQSENEEGYPRELVAHPNGRRCYENSAQNCTGRNIRATGDRISNGDGTYRFFLEVTFEKVVCCDNDEFYCWYFIFSNDLPATGFNSTVQKLSVNCAAEILKRRCYQPVTTAPPQKPNMKPPPTQKPDG